MGTAAGRRHGVTEGQRVASVLCAHPCDVPSLCVPPLRVSPLYVTSRVSPLCATPVTSYSEG